MKLKIFAWLVLLALLWGPSFLFVKVIIEEVPPLTLAAARVSLAGGLLYLVLRSQRQHLPKFGQIWGHFALTGLMLNALPYALSSWGAQYIDSALAAILISTEPLFVIILAHFYTRDDRLTLNKAIGVLIGFGGASLLFAPASLAGLQATMLGLIAVVLTALSYAVGVVYAKQQLSGLPALVTPTAQLLTASVYLLPLALIAEQPYTLSMPSWPALSSLLALAVICTALTFVLYFRIMDQASATHLSLVTYLVPIVGVLLGVMVLGEQPGWNAYAGCALILFGVMVVNGLIKVNFHQPDSRQLEPEPLSLPMSAPGRAPGPPPPTQPATPR
ncbi:MAG TPA: EamA family transporter [Anaerolineae bacterium]|nr:EamA family transporter [Anaerolineae bacterium]HMR62842.1 EamA family transporter [Anaerolineae bacterium]